MIGKITAAVAVAILLANAGVASAQTNRAPRADSVWQTPAPFFNNYYNEDYWRAVAPNLPREQYDPYAGTVLDGVAPY